MFAASTEPELAQSPEGMLRPSSLLRRVSIGLCTLLFGLAAAQFFATYWLLSRVTDESEQLAMLSTAPEIAEIIAPVLGHEPPDFNKLSELMTAFTKANPKLHLLLLDERGTIIASFGIDSFLLVQKSISLEPIIRLIDLDPPFRFPIYGPDPEHPGEKTIFSAARLVIGDRPGYLYVNLRAKGFQNLYVMSAENFAIKTIALLVIGSVLAVALFGFTFLRYLNRRLSEVLTVVRRFGKNDFSSRAPTVSNDEIAHLALEVNMMADRIEEGLTALKNRDAMRRQLIANVSHDLRGPVASIRGLLEVLQGMPEPQARVKFAEFQNSFLSSTTALQKLLSELFDLAKFEAQEKTPEQVIIDLAELLEDAVIGCRGVAESNKIRLMLNTSNERASITGDPEMLRRALQNLIENAIYYSKEGARVTVSLERKEDLVSVSVRDEGAGIPPHDIQRVMERFETGASSSLGGRTSSGLGLSIVQQILKLHGSTIEVSSTEGVGSTFHFSLPCAQLNNVKLTTAVR